jgi:hypothetical protein
MYGVLVGKASQPVRRGEALTTANLNHEAAPYHEKAKSFRWQPPDVSEWKVRKFLGYARSDGQVGTRNYWLVVPLVFCENRNILNLKQAFEEELGFARPQVYRKRVAELVKAHREGKRAANVQFESGDNGAPSDEQRVSVAPGWLRRYARGFEQLVRAHCGIPTSSECGRSDGTESGLSECAD